MTPPDSRSIARAKSRGKTRRRTIYVASVICVALVIGVAALVASAPWRSAHSTQPVRYLGVYEPDAPHSYAGLNQFAQAIGRQPNLVPYYSHWSDSFQGSFAVSAKEHGATTLIQIDPKNVSLASIANGQFDSYIRSYAAQIKAFKGHVVISFGHEMNGNWYSWGYQHTSAAVFVAAWRHLVTTFRAEGTANVTWLWTANIIDTEGPIIPNPSSWWPGSSYVNWVGIDGYYYTQSQTFAEVFGPTIVDVRAFTKDPILIAETGASQAAGQSGKVTDLFDGIQAYGLLGFVWFDANDTTQALDWRLNSPAALAAFRRDAQTFMKPPAKQTETQSASPGTSSPLQSKFAA